VETPTEEQKAVFSKLSKSLQHLAVIAARQQNMTRPRRHILADSVKVSLQLEDNWKAHLQVTYGGDVYESSIDYALLTLYNPDDLLTVFAKDLDRLIAKI